jgi:DNA polymerase-1
MRVAILDIEADSLQPKQIYCCVVLDAQTKKHRVYCKPKDLQLLLDTYDRVVAHNGIEFDFPVLARLWKVNVPFSKQYDTLVLSRLANQQRECGHSLESWGEELGVHKQDFEDWSHLSLEMCRYCKQDTTVTLAIYNALQKALEGFSAESIRAELRTQRLLYKQRQNGFKLDLQGAIDLKTKIDQEYNELIVSILKDFPPRKVITGQWTVKKNKDGKPNAVSLRIMNSDKVEPTEDPDVYNKVEYKEFCIDSPTEIVARLEPYWHPVIWNKPSKKNPDRPCTPKVCLENLETVGDDAPESIKNFVRCKVLKSRSTLIQSFIDACGPDGRVHGQVFSIGSVTHRMSHNNPNTANIPSRGLYGEECRRLWCTDAGRKIVGCDASGIQLRAFAHYLKDEDLIHQILHDDIHVYMAKMYGLLDKDVVYDETNPDHKKGRNKAKTTTYSILMGAGVAKVGQIVEGDGRKVMKNLEKNVKGWSKFKKEIDYRARLGYMIAIDGSKVQLKSAHFGMSCYLQSFEQAVVKWVLYEAYKRLTKLNIDFKQVAVVHDEIQYDVREDQAELLGQTVRQCFVDAGRHFKTLCPLDGEYKVGNNWSESH